MAVLSASTIIVKPDRYQDFVENSRKGKAIIEKSGGKNVRLLAGLVAGEATGSFVFTFEADDFADYGVVMGKTMADPEIRSVMSTGTASPTAGYQTSLWVDVPL